MMGLRKRVSIAVRGLAAEQENLFSTSSRRKEVGEGNLRNLRFGLMRFSPAPADGQAHQVNPADKPQPIELRHNLEVWRVAHLHGWFSSIRC